jgi:hypothetical protein
VQPRAATIGVPARWRDRIAAERILACEAHVKLRLLF